MINLLPPQLQADIRFAKLNVRLSRILVLLLIAGIGLAAVTLVIRSAATNRLRATEQQLAQRTSNIGEFDDVRSQVQVLEAKLNLVSQLLTDKTQYSQLLADLGAIIPPGARITLVSLTGDEKEPLEITMITASFSQAAQVRAALEASPRFTFVDIQSLSRNEETGAITAQYTATFAPGAAR